MLQTFEEALGRKWGSCSYSCPSVYGNASCVPDAFRCDGDADCLGEEDEQGCGDAAPMEDGDGETGDGEATDGQATTNRPTPGQEATSEFNAGQRATSGPIGDQEAAGGPTGGLQPEPTAEPTARKQEFLAIFGFLHYRGT
ncbi:CD320 antigen-like [Branchiostoma floridae]|uniref:CD320 antigen-like n=1 Tax=Branchiostoma floridae TaxID=7739 RepID=A0A9J7MXP5_BRAFL|nr:CD320 antigen-like [Branchiostoma floridae]